MNMMGSTGPFSLSPNPSVLLIHVDDKRNVPTLKSLSMQASIKLIQNSQQGSGKGGRDARGLKGMRHYLNENLPRSLQQEMIQEIAGLKKTETVLNLMQVLEPTSLIQDEVNMLGSIRLGFFHEIFNNAVMPYTKWFASQLDYCTLDVQQCDRLWHLIQWSNALKRKLLRNFIILTKVDALRSSNLPNVFARSPNLTSVTILYGCTNHILRILGRNCHSLRILNVSCSTAVTNSGLAGLLLKKWRSTTKDPFVKMTPASVAALSQEDKYPCAVSLRKLILLETRVTLIAINLGCILLSGSYYVGYCTDSLIIRPLGGRLGVTMANSTIVENEASLIPIYPGEENADTRKNIEYIVKRCVERVEADVPQILEHYSVPEWGYGQSFIRGENSYLVEAIIGTRLRENKYHITELVLTFNTWYWVTAASPNLTELGVNLPTLTLLKGRILGVWGQPGELFPNLVELDVWTANDDTFMSFLEFCPRIQKLKFTCFNFFRPITPGHVLNDENFARCMNNNESLLENLQEFIITVRRDRRPVRDFTLNSARYLLDRAPNLRRLGDLEIWNPDSNDIIRFILEFYALMQEKNKCGNTVRSGAQTREVLITG